MHNTLITAYVQFIYVKIATEATKQSIYVNIIWWLGIWKLSGGSLDRDISDLTESPKRTLIPR